MSLFQQAVVGVAIAAIVLLALLFLVSLLHAVLQGPWLLPEPWPEMMTLQTPPFPPVALGALFGIVGAAMIAGGDCRHEGCHLWLIDGMLAQVW
jgi:polyferredoxin